MSATVAILTSLMTFLKPSERATAHKSSGDQYLTLRNYARVFREIRLAHACDEQSALAGLDEFTAQAFAMMTTDVAREASQMVIRVAQIKVLIVIQTG